MRKEFEKEITINHNGEWKVYTVLGTVDIGIREKVGHVTRLSLDPNIQEESYLKSYEIEEVLDEDEREVVDFPDEIFSKVEAELEADLEGLQYNPEDELRALEAGY